MNVTSPGKLLTGIVLGLVVVLLGIFIVVHIASAQMPVVEEDFQLTENEDSEEMILVADVNLFDTKITAINDRDIDISFIISNGDTGIQSNTRYAVVLLEMADLDARIFTDQRIYDESLVLGLNSEVNKNITYTAPVNAQGDFEVWVEVRDQEGLLLTMDFAGNLSLEGEGYGLSIDFESCRLLVDEDSKEYRLLQGIDVDSIEELYLVCAVTNTTSAQISTEAQMTTHMRTLFGEVVDVEASETQNFILESGETKELTLTIAKAPVPQSYVASISFIEADEAIAVPLVIRYIVRGASISIQNIQLDKSEYEEGETIKLSVLWSLPADNFFDSRAPGTEIKDIYYDLSIKDSEGVDCIAPQVNQALNIADEQFLKLEFTSRTDCVSPAAAFLLSDGQGTVLAERQADFYNPQASIIDYDDSDTELQNNGISTTIIVGVISIILLIILLIFLRKKQSAQLVCLLILGAGLLFSADATHAATYVLSPSTSSSYLTFYINKSGSTFSPGQNIRISGSGTINSCYNEMYAQAWANGSRFLYRHVADRDGGGRRYTFPVAYGYRDINVGNACGAGSVRLDMRFDKLSQVWSSATARAWLGYNVVGCSPPSVSISDTNDPTNSGEAYQVNWSTNTGGLSTSCSIEQRQPINSSASSPYSFVSSDHNSFRDLSETIFNDTTYLDEWRISCSNSRGSNSDTTTHTIQPWLPTATLSQSTTEGETGTPYDITWSSTNADVCNTQKRTKDGNAGAWSSWTNEYTDTFPRRISEQSPTPDGPRTESITTDIDTVTSGLNYRHEWRVACTNAAGTGFSNTVEHLFYPLELANVTIDQSIDMTATGDSYDIIWTSENAENCDIERQEEQAYNGPWGGNGTITQDWTEIWNTTNAGIDLNDTESTVGSAFAADNEQHWRINCTNERPTGVNSLSDSLDHYVWARPVVILEICDFPSGGNCEATQKDIYVDDDTEINWSVDTRFSTTDCSAVAGEGFSTGGATSGSDGPLPQPDPSFPETYTVACTGNGGVASEDVILGTFPLPNLDTDDFSVRVGEDADITWDTAGADPATCTLIGTGGDPNLPSLSGGTGSITVTVDTTESYTLTCDNGNHTITIFAVPIIHET